jgi:hypothetical protein
MKASIGDQLHLHSNVVGARDKIATIMEIRGANGSPPYLVRFADGHETLIYPGADCVVEPAGGTTTSR